MTDDLWVFGYGSLMWRPGFAFTEHEVARVRGYHRALCVYSHVHRGTPEQPGLVLGLDRGGSCRGIVFRVAAEHRDETIAYLRAREQVTSVYKEAYLNAQLDDGRSVNRLVLYCRPQPRSIRWRTRALKRWRGSWHKARAFPGANPDYVRATQAHLAELGIADPILDWLAAQFADEARARSR